jgi:hypothetical protein
MIRLDADIKYQIRSIVNGFHVATSDDAIRADIRKRTASRHGLQGWPQSRIAAAEEFAVQVHHENGVLYSRVMSGEVR